MASWYRNLFCFGTKSEGATRRKKTELRSPRFGGNLETFISNAPQRFESPPDSDGDAQYRDKLTTTRTPHAEMEKNSQERRSDASSFGYDQLGRSQHFNDAVEYLDKSLAMQEAQLGIFKAQLEALEISAKQQASQLDALEDSAKKNALRQDAIRISTEKLMSDLAPLTGRRRQRGS